MAGLETVTPESDARILPTLEDMPFDDDSELAALYQQALYGLLDEETTTSERHSNDSDQLPGRREYSEIKDFEEKFDEIIRDSSDLSGLVNRTEGKAENLDEELGYYQISDRCGDPYLANVIKAKEAVQSFLAEDVTQFASIREKVNSIEEIIQHIEAQQLERSIPDFEAKKQSVNKVSEHLQDLDNVRNKADKLIKQAETCESNIENAPKLYKEICKIENASRAMKAFIENAVEEYKEGRFSIEAVRKQIDRARNAVGKLRDLDDQLAHLTYGDLRELELKGYKDYDTIAQSALEQRKFAKIDKWRSEELAGKDANNLDKVIESAEDELNVILEKEDIRENRTRMSHEFTNLWNEFNQYNEGSFYAETKGKNLEGMSETIDKMTELLAEIRSYREYLKFEISQNPKILNNFSAQKDIASLESKLEKTLDTAETKLNQERNTLALLNEFYKNRDDIQQLRESYIYISASLESSLAKYIRGRASLDDVDYMAELVASKSEAEKVLKSLSEEEDRFKSLSDLINLQGLKGQSIDRSLYQHNKASTINNLNAIKGFEQTGGLRNRVEWIDQVIAQYSPEDMRRMYQRVEQHNNETMIERFKDLDATAKTTLMSIETHNLLVPRFLRTNVPINTKHETITMARQLILQIRKLDKEIKTLGSQDLQKMEQLADRDHTLKPFLDGIKEWKDGNRMELAAQELEVTLNNAESELIQRSQAAQQPSGSQRDRKANFKEQLTQLKLNTGSSL